MTVEIKDKIYMRGELMTKGECDWLKTDSFGAPIMFVLATIMIGFGVPLGLVGTGFLLFKQEWWFPWDVAIAYPLLLIPCLPFGLWSAYHTFWKSWKSGNVKLKKLESGNYTWQDVDRWTMEKRGKFYRTADGQMPKIMYDMTLESFMNDAELPKPR